MKNKSKDGAQIEEILGCVTACAVKNAIEDLTDLGIFQGADVIGSDGAVYTVAQIDARWSPFSNRVVLDVQGFKHRRDGSRGTHKHPIGRPAEIKPCGAAY